MAELKTSVIVDLAGNLQRNAQKYGQAIGRFSKTGQRHLKKLNTVANFTGKQLDRLGNRYTAFLTGAAGVGSARMVVNLERRFTRLGIQANKSVEEMEQLKKLIYDTAQAPDIRIDPGEMTSAIEAIVEKTGDLQFAQDNIRNIGLAIQATGAEGGAIGELLAEFQKMGIKAPAEVLKAMDTLNVQGKEGAFTLQNLAALGPRVITAYTSMGRTGTDALKEMGAALQMIRMGTGSSEMAATAFEATLRTLGDPAKLKMLQKAGIQVFDPEKLKEGQRVLRPINELMAEIIQKTGGDKVKLGQVFDAEAVRAFNQAAGEFQRTGKLDSLDKFMSVQGDGTTTMADSARAAKDSAAALQNLYTAWKKFADESLTGPLQDAADLLHSLGSETTGKIIKGLVIGGAGALAVGKAWKFASWMSGRRRGGAGAAGGLGGSGVVPVYVTNMGFSMGAGGGRRGLSRGLGRAGGKWMRRLGGGLAVASAGLGLVNTLTDDSLSTEQKVEQSGGHLGGAAGGWAGAKLGAAIGTAILPGLGTAIGAALGGGLGYFAGEKLGETIGEKVADAIGDKESKLTVEVTAKDGAKADVRDMETSGMQVDVDSALNAGGAR